VTAVSVSPSGEWIASGDERGTVRIWANNPEQKLKLETFALGGKVMDIAWSGDNQRLCAVGEGRESYGKVFTWDSGNTLGAIDSHAKRINTCSFKPTKPLRIATGSDDLSVNWYEGPPFKFKTSHREHTRYPNCVRFSPDGEQMISVGADSKIVKYDGPTGEKIADIISDDPHSGTIFACAWAPDSKKLLTASADKSLKIWHVNVGKPQCTIMLSDKPEVGDMQVGCCWQGPTVCSLSLSGRLNLIDPGAGKIVGSLMGHNKAVTALALDRATPTRFATASFDGVICIWDARTGGCDVVRGKGHENGIVGLAIMPGDVLASAALDRTVKFAHCGTLQFNAAATVELGKRWYAVGTAAPDSVAYCCCCCCPRLPRLPCGKRMYLDLHSPRALHLSLTLPSHLPPVPGRSFSHPSFLPVRMRDGIRARLPPFGSSHPPARFPCLARASLADDTRDGVQTVVRVA
jgi:WD40 repeat protein